jgi:hypothetical protein
MNLNNTALFENINSKINSLKIAFGRLPKRDQMALLILSVFLAVFIIGGGGYWLHHKAEQTKEDANQQRQLLLWMRGQAPHLQANSGPVQSLLTIVQTTAAQQGISITQTETGGRLMVTASNPSFAVLGTWLTKLAQSGIQIDQLDIDQPMGDVLQLQATLTKP